ncbi:Synaptic vesicle glycoprotein 2B [Camponotus floridanus]|uniref:Synaptic vesicle glycoprotein 2B n=1 Tax=Camponotus floridanus TaxID=104421 RepID=E2AJF5_CAMFO|nr:synaptic vesicle glycoprotein 2A [Camponotus floridanus]EFN66476.1 Synaptic vesicle glycoprotein 2B [Camponotus floridanus]
MLGSDRENDKIATITENVNESADFNKAISTTGYGVFNVLLLLATVPIAWTVIFDTTSGAFILASAECDLELTFFRKGVLVAFPYIAMTTTAFIWDYITPYISMKILFMLALLIDSILNIVSSGVQSYYIFILVKFLSGILVGGPLAMVMTYLTEFHSARYQPRFTTWAGFLFALANIVPAALGIIILPLDLNINIFGLNYNSWRIYLLICSIPPVVGFVTATMLPESPKYLMAIGRSDTALKLLRRMYYMNMRQPLETFPIKALLVRQKTQLTRPVLEASLERMRVSLYNTKLLATTAYLPAFCFVSFLQFGSMLGFNTMRLWVPHLFIILNNFDSANWTSKDRQPTICEMLDRHAALPGRQYLNCTNFDDACFKWTINGVIYQNSTVIATSAVVFSFLTGFITITKLRKQIVMLTAFLISVASSFGINWAQSPPYMLTLASAVIVTTRIAGNIVTAVNVDVIPVPLRATSTSILTVIGNIAAIVGNLIFSALLGTKCIVAFMGLGCLFSVCFCVSLFFPQPVRESSKKLAEANTSKV